MSTEIQTFNNSVAKAFALLDCFTHSKREWGVRELASRLEANQSTTYRLMATLCAIGVLRKNPMTNKYSLGLKLFELGHMVDIHRSIVSRTHPILLNVSEKITETVHLGIYKDHSVLMIDKVESTQGLQLNSIIGSSSPAHCTGLGKVLLSGLSKHDFELFIQNKKLEKKTEATITSKSKLSDEIQKISGRGFALDKEEKELGLICLAVPVYNKQNLMIAALSAAGPAQRFNQSKLDQYVKILKKGAGQIKESIGDFHPDYVSNY